MLEILFDLIVQIRVLSLRFYVHDDLGQNDNAFAMTSIIVASAIGYPWNHPRKGLDHIGFVPVADNNLPPAGSC